MGMPVLTFDGWHCDHPNTREAPCVMRLCCNCAEPTFAGTVGRKSTRCDNPWREGQCQRLHLAAPVPEMQNL